MKRVKSDFQAAEISKKLKAVLEIAAEVQKRGKQVTTDDINTAGTEGATDVEIHDSA